MSQINWIRVYYFFHFGALGTIFPYLPLFFANRELKADQIAWIMSLNPITRLTIPPLWGVLADMFQTRIWLLRITAFGCAATILLFLIPDTWLGYFLVMGAFYVFNSPITSLADAAAHSLIGDHKESFAKIRVWGSLGFGIFALILGSLNASSRPLLFIPAGAVIYFLSGISSFFLLASPVQRQPHIVKQTIEILSDPFMLIFLFANGFYYAAHSTFDVFYGLHIRAIGHDDLFLGVSWAIGVGSEVLLMFWGAKKLLHLFSTMSVLIVCSLLSMLRWEFISLFTSKVFLLAVQPLHAFSFGLWYLAMVKHIQDKAPEHLRTSVQGIAASAVGLGTLLGYVGGGFVFEHFNGHFLFQLATACAGVACVFYCVVFYGQGRIFGKIKTSPTL